MNGNKSRKLRRLAKEVVADERYTGKATERVCYQNFKRNYKEELSTINQK